MFTGKRVMALLALLLTAWCVMTITHELGHVLTGLAMGGKLTAAELRPWKLPYSFFEPDPYPLLTLRAGPVMGVLLPLLVAAIVRQNWIWLIAGFCLLANGSYLALAWLSDDMQLDTPKLLHHGESRIVLALYCISTICAGYLIFRRSCIRLFRPQQTPKQPPAS